MQYVKKEIAKGKTLHSNLVLFKYKSVWQGKSKAIFFTFQSGSIQIWIEKQVIYISISLHSNLVLFKSCMDKNSTSHVTPLHSNLVLFKFSAIVTNLLPFNPLHSNLVLFKCNRRSIFFTSDIPLHSNLVLFKL